MLTSYPTSIAPESWATVFDLLHGTVPDPKKAAHVGWDCVGFALGKVLPDDGKPLMHGSPFLPIGCGTEDDLEVKECVKALATPGLRADTGAMPWGKIAAALIKALLTILGG